MAYSNTRRQVSRTRGCTMAKKSSDKKKTSRKPIRESLDRVFDVHKREFYKPKTDNQKHFVQEMHDKDLTVAYGPAGTGKTVLATQVAVMMLQEGLIDKIIVTRPMVVLEQNIGALPGELADKFGPYVAHAMEYFEEMLGFRETKNMIVEGKIEFVPMSFLRGKTFKNAFVILDEMQNSSPMQMKTALTRIGEGTKMVVLGDLKQQDLKGSDNGLKDLVSRLRPHKKIGVAQFTKLDIMRHGLISDLLAMYGED